MDPVIAEFPGDSKRLCPFGHAGKMLWPRALPRNMLPVEAWLERRPDDTHGNGIFGNYGDREAYTRVSAFAEWMEKIIKEN